MADALPPVNDSQLDELEKRIYDTLVDLESAEYIFTQGFDVVWTQGAIKRLAAEMRNHFRDL